jgi:hypothetical protein
VGAQDRAEPSCPQRVRESDGSRLAHEHRREAPFGEAHESLNEYTADMKYVNMDVAVLCLFLRAMRIFFGELSDDVSCCV